MTRLSSCKITMIVTNPLKKPSTRIWPSRDFTLGYSLAGLEDIFHAPTVVIDGDPKLIGSSNRLNSHTTSEPGKCDRIKRARRGQKGLTPHGKMLVKNAASYLEKRHGKKNLSFLTVTIPSVSAEESKQISRCWSEIVRKFQQSITRHLSRQGLPPLVVGVTEVQEKRFERDGVLGLHLHLVFVGKRPRGGVVPALSGSSRDVASLFPQRISILKFLKFRTPSKRHSFSG